MPIDPRTPVLVGAGQINHRDSELEPVELIAAAALGAEADSGGSGLLAAIDSVRLVSMLSWRYRDPGALVASLIGAQPTHSAYTFDGGDGPQALISGAARDIVAGRAEVVLVGGAEAWRTRTRLRSLGERPRWTRQDESVPAAQRLGSARALLGDAEQRIGLDRPAAVYPLFEQALRIAAGRSVREQLIHSAALWSRSSEVAARNPNAWTQRAHTVEEIATPSPSNRWVFWPYPKLMNANNMVEQGAALLVCSAAAAARAGVPREQWIFPWAGTEAHDTYAIGARAGLHRSPAIRIAGRSVLQLTDVGLDDIGLVDVYSCFPSAVQVAATELGLPLDDPARPLTLTGGLTFAGGPWNNYVTHSIATMMTALREKQGLGLITANGGYLTKHAMGLYGTQPPPDGFRWANVQSDVDREPTIAALDAWEGVGALESWTVGHGRAGEPEAGFMAVRTPDGARTFAVTREPDQLKTLVTEDITGAAVAVRADGTGVLESARGSSVLTKVSNAQV